jgi:hypothetical protein
MRKDQFIKHWISSSSWWTTPILILINGGIRIHGWHPKPGYETEIYVSIDSGTYSLITTTAPGVSTYDYVCDDGHDYTFKIRSKLDQTILNAPINLSTSLISGGVRLMWDDNNTEADHIQIWANINGVGFLLVETILNGVETYDHIIASGSVTYKIRAYEGTLPVFSSYSETSSILITSYNNTGGKGDRRAIMSVTTNLSVYLGIGISELINGVTTGNNTYTGSGTAVGKYIIFDFGIGVSKVIDEAKYYLGSASNNGVWKWQGSNNGVDYIDIGETFTLTNGILSSLNGNTTGYRYYRLIGISGTVASEWIREMEFKIG